MYGAVRAAGDSPRYGLQISNTLRIHSSSGAVHTGGRLENTSTSASPIRLLMRASSRSWSMPGTVRRSEEHTSELQSQSNLVCRLLLEKKKKKTDRS